MGEESSTIQLPRVNAPKLFIGLPIYGSVEPNFFCSYSKFLCDHLSGELGISCKIKTLFGDSLIPRARNHITRLFLESDCTHLLFIDSDLIFSSDHIKRIVENDKDIVGGFYQKKKEGEPDLVCNWLSEVPQLDSDDLVSLRYVGTGFICIKRCVFESMIAEYGDEIGYWLDDQREVKEYDLWSVGVYNKYKDGTKARYLSEDWYFCQRALDLGFEIFGDARVMLGHAGHAVYPLSYQRTKLFSKPLSTVDADSAAVELLSPTVSAAV